MADAAKWAEDTLDYRFNDAGLIKQAFTHRSAANRHNERLEFLGDAVLELVITDAIYHQRPDMDEGGLSRLRSNLVRKATLAEIAQNIDIAKQLILGSGERRTGGHQRSSILADALEAVLGAVYLDGGYADADAVINKLFAEHLKELPDEAALKDPKTRLQEFLQADALGLPEYEVLKVSGKSHAQTFEVLCKVPGHNIEVKATGASRRKAEQQAAEDALKQLTSENNG